MALLVHTPGGAFLRATAARWNAPLPRPRGRTIGLALALALAIWATSALLAPDSANADLFGVGGKVKDAIAGSIDLIIKKVFSGPTEKVVVPLLEWFVKTENLANYGGDNNIVRLNRVTTSMAAGGFGAVLTLSVVRFWLAGLWNAGSEGFEAIQGITRSTGALFFIVLWPWLFKQSVAVANTAVYALLRNNETIDDISRLLLVAVGVSVASSPIWGWFIPIVIAVFGMFMLLGLVLLKITAAATLIFLFVAMPLAVMLWPITELSWVASYALRTFFVVLCLPIIWALCFATMVAVGVDAFSFGGGLGRAVVRPMVAIGMFMVLFGVTRALVRAAMPQVGPGSGVMAGSARYAAGRAAYQQAPAGLGAARDFFMSRGSSTPGQPASGGSGTGSPSSSAAGKAAALAAGVATGGAGAMPAAAGAASTAGAAGASPAAGMPNPSAGAGMPPSSSAAGGAPVPVAPTPSMTAPPGGNAQFSGFQSGPSTQEHLGEVEGAIEAASKPDRPVAQEAAAAAYGNLSPAQQQGVRDLATSREPASQRAHLAEQSVHPDHSDGEQRAFATLAAAAPDVRAAAIGVDDPAAAADGRAAVGAAPSPAGAAATFGTSGSSEPSSNGPAGEAASPDGPPRILSEPPPHRGGGQ